MQEHQIKRKGRRNMWLWHLDWQVIKVVPDLHAVSQFWKTRKSIKKGEQNRTGASKQSEE